MAHTVSTDLTNITTAETYTGWTDISGGSGGAVEPDFFVQGSNCVSRPVSGTGGSRGMVFDIGAGNTLDFSSGGANEDELVYFWIQVSTPALTDGLAQAPGLRIRIAETSATSDYAEWDIVYSDLLTPPGTDAFRVYALDPRAPPTRTSGTWDYNSCRYFGAVLDTNATAKGRNLSIDRISHGFGELIITGTSDNERSGLQEGVDWDWGDVNQRWGIIVERSGVAFVKGKIVIGDGAGTSATTLTAQDTTMVWEPTFYYDGTRVRPTVGYDDSQNWTGLKSDGTSYYGVEFRGNGTGDTSVTFGAAVGTGTGRSGPTFIGSDQLPTTFVGDDGAVEGVAIYGTTFRNFRSLDFDSNAASDVVYSCNFVGCGTFDAGPVEVRNCNFIDGLGGAYTFLERFINTEASAAEQLSTADPITEWTDSLNGTDWSVPSATAGYVELLGGTTRTNLTVLDDDKVGADNHYAECIIRFPAAGAGQGTLGPVIACHATNDDYFWLEVDLTNDQIELFRVNTGTATSIAGPTTFTMDEDEDYVVLLRRNGTTIEGFASGNSVADGFHTTKLSATDAAHTGTAQRLIGLRGDALAGQTGATGERPRVRLFGGGPITDNLGALLFPTTGTTDIQSCALINCTRAFSFDNTGTYTLTDISLSGNLVDAHNDSGGLVTGNVVDGTVPSSARELLGASTFSFSASVNLQANGLSEASYVAFIGNGGAEDGNTLLSGYANASGIVSGSFSGTTPQVVRIVARNGGIIAACIQDDGGAFTDYTSAARDRGTANDVVLLPAVPAVADATYFGGIDPFGEIRINVTTAGTTYVGTWEYYNGSWTALTTTDDTNDFQTSGVNSVTFTAPNDWTTTSVNSQGPYYYVRFRVTTGGGAGAQAETVTLNDTVKYQDRDDPGTIQTGTGLTVTVPWQEDPNNS